MEARAAARVEVHDETCDVCDEGAAASAGCSLSECDTGSLRGASTAVAGARVRSVSVSGGVGCRAKGSTDSEPRVLDEHAEITARKRLFCEL